MQTCFGAALGGAVSNYADARSPTGVVNCFVFRPCWAFNLADVAICIGTLLGLLTLAISMAAK